MCLSDSDYWLIRAVLAAAIELSCGALDADSLKKTIEWKESPRCIASPWDTS